MNYELAKELKDAGFPQPTGLEHPLEWRGKIDCAYGVCVYFPTLTELIEKCGDAFDCLMKHQVLDIAWYATGNVMPGFTGEGKTREEAVARLWLALYSTE